MRKGCKFIAMLLIAAMLMQTGGEGISACVLGVSTIITNAEEGDLVSGNPASATGDSSGNPSGNASGNPSDTSEEVVGDSSGDLPEEAEYISIKAEALNKKLVYKQPFTTADVEIKGIKNDTDASGNAVSLPVKDCTFFWNDKELKEGSTEISAEMGEKVITVKYKDLSATYKIDVVPDKTANIQQLDPAVDSIYLTWDVVEGATGYQIMKYDEAEKKWKSIKGGPTNNYVTTNQTNIKSSNNITITPATVYTFRIRAYYGTTPSVAVYGEMTDSFTAVTTPEQATPVVFKQCSPDSVTFSWNPVNGADGYIVEYKATDDPQYTTLGDVGNVLEYGVAQLKSAKSYYFRVKAYKVSDAFAGKASTGVKFSTSPAETVVTMLSGSKAAKVSWKKVSGATGYYIYAKKSGEEEFKQIADIKQGTYYYIKLGLVNGVEYEFQVKSYRTVSSFPYASLGSEIKKVVPAKIKATSTKAKYFKSYKKFKKSKVYTTNKWFKKYVLFKKSIIIPGAINTNAGGFSSTRMTPQGITAAGSYIIMSAYDYNSNVNTVLYVMKKSNGKLMTTIVLPDQVHAGGLAYDGTNLWVSHGSNAAAIRFSKIKSAAKKKKTFQYVEYDAMCKVKTTASYMTYYKGMLWVGKVGEQGKQPLYSYTIGNKSSTPTLTAKKKINLPDRVQGLAFLPNGDLVLSRGNLYLDTMPYYISQLDYYSPKWSGDNIKSLKKCKNVCPMPSMSEGITISGNTIYVCNESTAFSTVTAPMDRICAFKTSSLTKKVK